MESTELEQISPTEIQKEEKTFYFEVVDGLSQPFKKLPSMYFYDQVGDKLFQKIMSCDEYYLTRSEAEIFSMQSQQIASVIQPGSGHFDVIELGAGDGTKTTYLLNQLQKEGVSFTYMPIDISGSILEELRENLLLQIPGLDMSPMQGEYFDMLQQATKATSHPKLVLFLGSNIGNMPPQEALLFGRQMRQFLKEGDLVLIGFDLVKDPDLVRKAYSDKQGYTRSFNLNLLKRINRELGADFNIDYFEHYCSYDPLTGACKSYLVSQRKQVVAFPDTQFHFEQGECIWMEISQKYSLPQIDQLATQAGFETIERFTDKNSWFADVVWKAV
ncbi:MAG TPA: L-histidine N(alpha)-methyltransferase [Dyadobacter sp.]|jgi:dimethylhistidine N-methyltransferase|nr:L-histidine N(alpha)-methyltransferase [Dyadobacter sp.]